MQRSNRFQLPHILLCVVMTFLLFLASCGSNVEEGGEVVTPPGSQAASAEAPSDPDDKAAYLEIIQREENDLEDHDFYGSLRNIGRAALYGIDGDGQDELVYVCQKSQDMLHCSIWSFENGSPVLIVDSELASTAGAGTGGVNVVEYEGKRYFCGWAYNSAPWDLNEANIYYDCFLWEYPNSSPYLTLPYESPEHIFRFRYYTGEGNEIRTDAFSFVKDDHIALSIDEFKVIKDQLIDHPVQKLCKADILHAEGLSFEELKEQLEY